MKTFNETLRINNCKRQLVEVFYLMSRSGVDPMRFVDWYTLDGIEKQNQGLLVEASEEWLREAWYDPLVNAGKWVAQGAKDIATGNLDYGAMGDRAQKVGQGVGNVLTAPIAAGTAMAGGAARGLLGSGAKNLAGGVMGGLGLGGNNTTPEGGEGAAPPGSTPGTPGAGGPGAGTPGAGGGAGAGAGAGAGGPGAGAGAGAGGPGAGAGAGAGGPGAKPADPNAQHIQQAHAALDALSKRMGNSKNLAQELGGQPFQSMVANLLYMLKNNQVVAPAEAAPAEAAPEANPPAPAAEDPPRYSSAAGTPSVESNGFANFMSKIRLRNQINSGLRSLQECNVDPRKFVEWYIEEGQYLAENAVGDWFGRQWAGLGGLFSGKGYMKAGEEWQTNTDKKRDDDAVLGAINTLWQFQREMKNNKANFTDEFAKLLGQVTDVLQKRGAAKKQAGGSVFPSDPKDYGEKFNPEDPAHKQAIDPDSSFFDEELFRQAIQTMPEATRNEITKQWAVEVGKVTGQATDTMSEEQLSALVEGLPKDKQAELTKFFNKTGYEAYKKHAGLTSPPQAAPPPSTPQPAQIEPGGESGSNSANTPAVEGVFYKYLKRRA
jgi:hypothetical protein